MLAYAVEGASRQDQEKARRAAAHLLEIGPGRPGMGRRRLPGPRRPGAEEDARRSRIMLHLFKHSFLEDMESGLDALEGVRPPVHDHAVGGP